MEHAKDDMRDAFKTYRYDRSVSVRVRGSLSMWSLRLRRRKQRSKEDMFPDVYPRELLSLIA